MNPSSKAASRIADLVEWHSLEGQIEEIISLAITESHATLREELRASYEDILTAALNRLLRHHGEPDAQECPTCHVINRLRQALVPVTPIVGRGRE